MLRRRRRKRRFRFTNWIFGSEKRRASVSLAFLNVRQLSAVRTPREGRMFAVAAQFCARSDSAEKGEVAKVLGERRRKVYAGEQERENRDASIFSFFPFLAIASSRLLRRVYAQTCEKRVNKSTGKSSLRRRKRRFPHFQRRALRWLDGEKFSQRPISPAQRLSFQ